MENQICPLHNQPMQAKDGEFGPYHSHIIKDVGFCNGKKITPFKNKPVQATSAPQLTPQGVPAIGGYEDPKINSMFACNAMNNAVAMVNAGIIADKSLGAAYRRILSILEGKKEPQPEDLDNWQEGQ